MSHFADGAAVANSASDTQNAATLLWSRYRANFGVTGDAADMAATSTSPREGLRLIARNMLRGIRAMASLLNGHLFSGAPGGNNVTGMDTAYRNDNTYATVDRTSGANAGFRGNMIDPGVSTPPTQDLIRKDIGDTIYSNSDSEGPDVAFSKPNVFYKVASLFDAQRRYNQDTLLANLNSGRQIILDASVGAINIEGCTFIKDKDATAAQIYYVNTNYARVLLLPQAPPSGMPNLQTAPEGLNDGGGALPYQLRVKALPDLGDEQRVTMIMKPCFQVESPITGGLRLNVAVT
jgi:hypothetical protein